MILKEKSVIILDNKTFKKVFLIFIFERSVEFLHYPKLMKHYLKNCFD